MMHAAIRGFMTGIKITRSFTEELVNSNVILMISIRRSGIIFFFFFPPRCCALQLVAIWWKASHALSLDVHAIDEALSDDVTLL